MTNFLVNGGPVNTSAWSWIITSNSYVCFVKEGKKEKKTEKYMETDSFRDDGAGLGVTGDDLDGAMTRGEEDDNRCEEE